jgi:hypothetical protein
MTWARRGPLMRQPRSAARSAPEAGTAAPSPSTTRSSPATWSPSRTRRSLAARSYSTATLSGGEVTFNSAALRDGAIEFTEEHLAAGSSLSTARCIRDLPTTSGRADPPVAPVRRRPAADCLIQDSHARHLCALVLLNVHRVACAAGRTLEGRRIDLCSVAAG